ncbi:MAG: DNA repair protein RecN [Acidimicrobiales bacterium]|nr:MAG: DNA repair protein RecN [Actinomycetota bacterium]MBV6507130.1 DNA repair protein RecN [Acidimicrobiales bacterium]RIK05572.1 MAG: DNA repair protein RecN [Acidobacteriota bacterium]
MLAELAVRDLGVIADLRLVFGSGLTALTGETGAGKTMIVEAIGLLLGGRADPARIRPGATEAVVEGRLVIDGRESVLRRVVPAEGRSRAYLDGQLATAASLADIAGQIVELHGQNSAHWLRSASAQRQAVDGFGAVDLTELSSARAELSRIERDLSSLGGDARARARELDLLRYQVEELEGAQIRGPDEDTALCVEEDTLGDAVGHRDAAMAATRLLSDDGGALDLVAAGLAALGDREPFRTCTTRLSALLADLADIGSEIRAVGEAIEPDEQRLEEIRTRRQLFRNLMRKYGDSLAEVLAFAAEAKERLELLAGYEDRVRELEDIAAAVRRAELDAARVVMLRRQEVAPALAEAVSSRFEELALPEARLRVHVGTTPPGDEVRFELAANRGGDFLPLARSASGGELSRIMLALRLVLSEGPPTMVFDEVDAGVGGAAAVSVGRALARLARDRQVLVVTHLPQVAAFADVQLAVAKTEGGHTTEAEIRVLDGEDRVVELSRMLSGSPESRTAHQHAQELLTSAAAERGR